MLCGALPENRVDPRENFRESVEAPARVAERKRVHVALVDVLECVSVLHSPFGVDAKLVLSTAITTTPRRVVK